MSISICSIEGCDRVYEARGWCKLHYYRWRMNGDPLVRRRIIGDDVARFWTFVDRRGDDECWLWRGALDKWGYPQIRIANRTKAAHRFSFEIHHGIKLGKRKLDHRCDMPPCVNYKHLRIATLSQNNCRTRRSREKSPYRGVHPYNGTRWTARIGNNGKCTHLGCFDLAEDAARAYDDAARGRFGEFARLNFPEESR